MNELELIRWLIAEIEHRDDPTDDDVTQLDVLIERGETLVEEERAQSERQARIDNLARHAADPRNHEAGFEPPHVHSREADPFDMSRITAVTTGDDIRSQAYTAIEGMPHLDDAHREEATRTIERADNVRGDVARHILATGSDAYRRAFRKRFRDPQCPLEADEQRAVDLMRAASLTDASGGYAVPFTLDPTIILTNDGTANPFRQIARRVQITTENWNGVSSAGVTASWDAEAAEVSDDAPTLAQPSIPVYKGQAFVPFSVEIGGDWAGFEADVRNLIMDAKDRLEGAAFATGTGSAQPTGIVTALTGGGSVVASATTDTFAIADVYSTLEATGPRFRSNSSWVANLNIINDIRQFATANNYHAFLTDLAGGQPSQMLGRPLYECSDMDGVINASAENYVLVNGDFSNFVIVDRVGLSIELVPHLFHTSNNRPSGQRGYLAWWRVGSDSVNDAAFSMLNVT